MKILSCDYLVTCDENFSVIEDGAIVFDEKIIHIDTKKNIQKKYTQEIEDLGKNSVIMPGLINPHVHLEFSANKSTLEYGNFVSWLDSVIKNRDSLFF
jgi:cytosine/adenosine deaminase-related metal-dependent hydrolase